jgi:hypothetical protein
LRVDGRLRDLVRDFLDHHGRVIDAKAVPEPDQIVLAEGVVLIKQADLPIPTKPPGCNGIMPPGIPE